MAEKPHQGLSQRRTIKMCLHILMLTLVMVECYGHEGYKRKENIHLDGRTVRLFYSIHLDEQHHVNTPEMW